MLHRARWLHVSTIVLGGWLVAHEAVPAQVRGTATYRERVALPPNAVFEATLEDVTKADAPAELIGRYRADQINGAPIRFEINYDPSEIDPSHRYVVRGRIVVGGKLLLHTDPPPRVLTGGRGTQVSLLLTPANGTAPAVSSSTGATLGALPATYFGDLPCADCEAVRHQLELFPDKVFFLRLWYLGKGDSATIDDIGIWSLSASRDTVTLTGNREASVRFLVTDSATLSKLSPAGDVITSTFEDGLKRTRNVPPLSPRLRMRGMYTYSADAGRFTECLTRKTWPVAAEGDNAALESAYTMALRKPADTLMVDLEGQLALRPGVAGGRSQRALIVERFGRVDPGERCAPNAKSVTVERTYWRLTRLGDTAVRPGSLQWEPHLILHPDSRRMSGSDGCSRLRGRYELDESSLVFTELATTSMSCPEEADPQRELPNVLKRVSTVRLIRQQIEMFDANGKFLARFEARELK